jgi:NAD-dependent deacetylase
VLKPDTILYGEMIPPQAAAEAQMLARECDLILIVGTSAETTPASNLPYTAKSVGAKLVEINLSPTVLTTSSTDYFLQGSASEILPALVDRVRAIES